MHLSGVFGISFWHNDAVTLTPSPPDRSSVRATEALPPGTLGVEILFQFLQGAAMSFISPGAVIIFRIGRGGVDSAYWGNRILIKKYFF